MRAAVRQPASDSHPHPGAAMLIISAHQWTQLREALQAGGVDVAQHVKTGRLTALDAEDTLASILTDTGVVDVEAVRRLALPLLRATSERWGHISMYGEMAPILWQQGKVAAALELEQLWNLLAEERSFSVLCGYPTPGPAERPPNPSGPAVSWDRLVDAHTSVRQPG